MAKLSTLIVDGKVVFPSYGEHEPAVARLCMDDTLSMQHLHQIFRQSAGACATEALTKCGVSDAMPATEQRAVITRLLRFIVTGWLCMRVFFKKNFICMDGKT